MLELSKSEKDYMEAIYVLNKRLNYVRSVDVADYLGYSKPSVTRAMSNLRRKGCILKDTYDLEFTELGWKTAEHIFERHCILTHALTEIGIDEEVAINDARLMERVISEHSVNLAATTIQCQKWLRGFCPTSSQIVAMVNG
jgi:Mn-dependent DtxR family transcriptional regulator